MAHALIDYPIYLSNIDTSNWLGSLFLKPLFSIRVVYDMKSIFYSFFFLLISLFLLSGCSKGEEVEAQEPISYLALGDSYTIGQGVEVAFRWPNQLSDKLRESGFVVDSTHIIARTGWTTGDLTSAVENANPEGFNLVSLLIGVNNQFRGLMFSTFTYEFDLLLNTAIELGGEGRVFVLSIPDYGVTPFGSNNSEQIALELDEYNEYIRQKCEARNVPFIDVTGISRELGDSPGALAPDNLHPSGSQYTQWMEAAYPEVQRLLGE